MKTNFLYRVLISSYAISTFAEGIIMPIYAVFVQKIGGTILDASGAIAVFLILNGVATIIIHRSAVEPTQTARCCWSSGALVWVAGIATYLIISSVPTLFMAQVLVALGNAIADPAFDAELDDHTDEQIKSYEWGMFEALKDVLNGVAALTGGLIAGFFGFRALIFCMIVAATLSFAGILYYVRIRNKKHPSPVTAS